MVCFVFCFFFKLRLKSSVFLESTLEGFHELIWNSSMDTASYEGQAALLLFSHKASKLLDPKCQQLGNNFASTSYLLDFLSKLITKQNCNYRYNQKKIEYQAKVGLFLQFKMKDETYKNFSELWQANWSFKQLLSATLLIHIIIFLYNIVIFWLFKFMFF